ncbi:hypothetical protein, partial [Streptomyces sp. NPDC058157]|uniref:hypothetical protein n=1 Tax=Streptomyces sp. NPDC058157 TaxID=3346360 RepID=UPI0036E475E7
MSSALLADKKVAILAASGVEQDELVRPRDAVRAAGARTVHVTVDRGDHDGKEHAIRTHKHPADRDP